VWTAARKNQNRVFGTKIKYRTDNCALKKKKKKNTKINETPRLPYYYNK